MFKFLIIGLIFLSIKAKGEDCIDFTGRWFKCVEYATKIPYTFWIKQERDASGTVTYHLHSLFAGKTNPTVETFIADSKRHPFSEENLDEYKAYCDENKVKWIVLDYTNFYRNGFTWGSSISLDADGNFVQTYRFGQINDWDLLSQELATGGTEPLDRITPDVALVPLSEMKLVTPPPPIICTPLEQ